MGPWVWGIPNCLGFRLFGQGYAQRTLRLRVLVVGCAYLCPTGDAANNQLAVGFLWGWVCGAFLIGWAFWVFRLALPRLRNTLEKVAGNRPPPFYLAVSLLEAR